MKNTHSISTFETRTDFGFSGLLPKFNPALGTLTGVKLTIEGNTASRFRVENREQQPRTASVSANTQFTTIVGGASIDLAVPINHSKSLTASDGGLDFSGTSGFCDDVSGVGSKSVDVLDTEQFLGIGTVPVAVAAAATAECNGLGDYVFVVNTSASAIVTVEYTFTPNP